jgi:hypothetical protein
MRPRPLLLRMGVVFLITLDTIRRMDSETRPIDWWLLVIEVLVLAIIAAEFVRILLRERRTHKRLITLHAIMAKGQELQRTVPNNGQSDKITAWANSVEEWIKETAQALDGYSPQAAAAFNQGIGTSVHYPHVHGALQGTHNILLRRLDNLRGIMEKPEVYY